MSRKQTHALSEPERERRRRNVRATTGNQALEGLHPDEGDFPEFDAYINGGTTVAEMIRRTKRQCGGEQIEFDETPITIHDLDPDACGISAETGEFMLGNTD